MTLLCALPVQACRLVESVMASLFVPAVVLHNGPDDVSAAGQRACSVRAWEAAWRLQNQSCMASARCRRWTMWWMASSASPRCMHSKKADFQTGPSSGCRCNRCGMPGREHPPRMLALHLCCGALLPALLQGLTLLPQLNGMRYADLPERGDYSRKTFDQFPLSVTRFKNDTSEEAVLRVCVGLRAAAFQRYADEVGGCLSHCVPADLMMTCLNTHVSHATGTRTSTAARTT